MTVLANHASVQQLVARTGAPWVDEQNLEQLIAAPCSVLFVAGDPVQHPESLDVAVILPELLREFPEAFSLAVVRADAERAIAARYALRNLPGLLFFRAGHYVTALTGVYDWQAYRQHMAAALAQPAAGPTRVSLPMFVDAAGSCNGGTSREH